MRVLCRVEPCAPATSHERSDHFPFAIRQSSFFVFRHHRLKVGGIFISSRHAASRHRDLEQLLNTPVLSHQRLDAAKGLVASTSLTLRYLPTSNSSWLHLSRD